MKNRACPAQSVPECPMASKVASRPSYKECPAGPSWPNGAEMRAISSGAIVNRTVSEQNDAPGFLREADPGARLGLTYVRFAGARRDRPTRHKSRSRPRTTKPLARTGANDEYAASRAEAPQPVACVDGDVLRSRTIIPSQPSAPRPGKLKV
jgi:hypothetical protein